MAKKKKPKKTKTKQYIAGTIAVITLLVLAWAFFPNLFSAPKEEVAIDFLTEGKEGFLKGKESSLF